MPKIRVNENTVADLAEFTIVGEVQADDIIAIAEKHPAFRMRKHLVDMTKADIHLLDSSGLTRIAYGLKKMDRDRHRGRTAIVVPSKLETVIPYMFSLISKKQARREEVFMITLSRDDALSWLSDDDT